MNHNLACKVDDFEWWTLNNEYHKQEIKELSTAVSRINTFQHSNTTSNESSPNATTDTSLADIEYNKDIPSQIEEVFAELKRLKQILNNSLMSITILEVRMDQIAKN